MSHKVDRFRFDGEGVVVLVGGHGVGGVVCGGFPFFVFGEEEEGDCGGEEFEFLEGGGWVGEKA